MTIGILDRWCNMKMHPSPTGAWSWNFNSNRRYINKGKLTEQLIDQFEKIKEKLQMIKLLAIDFYKSLFASLTVLHFWPCSCNDCFFQSPPVSGL